MSTASLTYEQILRELPRVLAEVLGLDVEDIRPEHNFWTDLDGESIDLLDLNFRAERAFNVKSPLGVLMGAAELPLDPDGCLSADSFERVCRQFPFLPPSLTGAGGGRIRPADLQRSLTVDLIARFIEAAAHPAGDQAAGRS